MKGVINVTTIDKRKGCWGIHSVFLVVCVRVWYSAGWELVRN